MVKQVWLSILCAISIAFISTGCGGGGSSGPKMVDLTVTVPATGTLKKGKFAKTVSIADVKGVVLADGTEVSGEEEEGTFTIRVPEGSDVHIQATITDENGSEFTFESFVNDASESDQVVDEDSTRVANLLVYDGVKNNTSIKDLLLSENDVIGKWKELLSSFQSRDAINELLENADSDESVEDLANKVADLIAELKEINRVLAIFENRLNLFANSNDVIRISALSETDVVTGEIDEESDSDVINEFLVRPYGVKDVAAGIMAESTSDASGSSVNINEDGSISVERDGESSTTDSILTKDRFSGRFISFSENVLIIGVTRRGEVNKEDFYVSEDSKDLIALAESFQENDSIAVSYAENDSGKKIVKAIFAEGFLSGTLTALSKTSVTLTLSNGSIVTMPIKDYTDKIIFTLPPVEETSKAGLIVRMPLEEEKKPKPDVESIDPIFETTTVVDATDVEIEITLDDASESDVKVGDLVIVHWKVIENVKVSIAIYPDLPMSFDDPILTTDANRPVVEGDEEVKDASTILVRQ